jgi:hypothetical protein
MKVMKDSSRSLSLSNRRGEREAGRGHGRAGAIDVILLGGVLLAGSACSQKQTRVEAPVGAATAGTSRSGLPTSSRTVAGREGPRPDEPMMPLLQRFSASVDALDASSPALDHPALIDALRGASRVLEAISGRSGADTQVPRDAAARIEAAGPGSSSHADAVVSALSAAQRQLRVLEARAGGAREYAGALARLDLSLRRLSPRRPLLEQRPGVVDAFRALEGAVFVAAGQAPPSARAVEAAPPTVDTLLSGTRERVTELAGADLTNVRVLAASAMSSLADLVAALGADPDRRNTAEMRFQAERLRRARSSSFAQTDWVERGLVAALDALDAWRPCRSEVVKDWSEAARDSATLIPDHGSLAFQHAHIQDAFRATTDAFAIALVQARTCPAGRTQLSLSTRSEADSSGSPAD